MKRILRITSETGAGLLARHGLIVWGDKLCRKRVGARERTRTSTTLRSLAPEASASASSATRAQRLTHSLYRLTSVFLLLIFFFLNLNCA